MFGVLMWSSIEDGYCVYIACSTTKLQHVFNLFNWFNSVCCKWDAYHSHATTCDLVPTMQGLSIHMTQCTHVQHSFCVNTYTYVSLGAWTRQQIIRAWFLALLKQSVILDNASHNHTWIHVQKHAYAGLFMELTKWPFVVIMRLLMLSQFQLQLIRNLAQLSTGGIRIKNIKIGVNTTALHCCWWLSQVHHASLRRQLPMVNTRPSSRWWGVLIILDHGGLFAY